MLVVDGSEGNQPDKAHTILRVHAIDCNSNCMITRDQNPLRNQLCYICTLIKPNWCIAHLLFLTKLTTRTCLKAYHVIYGVSALVCCLYIALGEKYTHCPQLTCSSHTHAQIYNTTFHCVLV